MADADRRFQVAIKIARAEKIRLQRIQLKRDQEERAFLRESNALKFQEETAQEKKLRFKAEGEKWIREKLKLVQTIENIAITKLKTEKKELLENERNFLREGLERSKQAAERAARLELEKKMRYDKERSAREEKERLVFVENQRLIKIENERIRAEKLRAESMEDAKRKAKSLVLKARAEEAERIRIKVYEAKLEEEEKIYRRQLLESSKVETPIERKLRFKAEGERWIREKIGQVQSVEKSAPMKSEIVRKNSIDKHSTDSERSGYKINTEKGKADTVKLAMKEREKKMKFDQERLIRQEYEKKVSMERQNQWRLDNEKFEAERALANAKVEAEKKTRLKEAKAFAEEAARMKFLLLQAKIDERENAISRKTKAQKEEGESAQEKKKRFKAEGEKWIREKIALCLNEEREAEIKAKLDRKLLVEAERKNLLETEARIKQEADRMAREENEKRIRLNNERIIRESKEKDVLKEKQKQIRLENERILSERLKLNEVIRRCKSLEIKGRAEESRGYPGPPSQDLLFGCSAQRRGSIEFLQSSISSLSRYKGKSEKDSPSPVSDEIESQ